MRYLAVLLGVLVLLPAGPSGAQARTPDPEEDDFRRATPLPQWEARLEGVAADAPTVLGAVGVNWRAGWYARPAVLVGLGGVQPTGGGAWTGALRVDAAVRFHLDPFAERPRGLYGGVGVSWRHLAASGIGGGETPILTAHAGLEGRKGAQRVWALELGLGGGVRAAVILRKARRGPAR